MDNIKSRRQILMAAGTGAVTALAGCSGNGSDGEGEPSPEDGEQSDSETQTEQSTYTESTTEQAETSTETSSSDTVYDGEEELESLIDESEYHWIEFEESGEQISLPLPEGIPGTGSTIGHYIDEGEVPVGEFDTMYMLFNGPEEDLTWAFLLEENYDEDIDPQENLRSEGGGYYGGPLGTASQSGFEEMFDEVITGYTDVSEDVPQEYLDIVNQ